MTKVKRVIEIEESDYELSCQRYGDARYNGYQPDYENTAIAQSVPYNPSGDAISREALKGVIETYRPALIYNNKTDMKNRMVDYFLDEIDNAEAIPLPNEQIAWEQGYEAGLAQGKCDRSHGEWLKSGKGKTTFFCSECGRKIDTKPFTRPDKFPFCHCGADMRKGDAE